MILACCSTTAATTVKPKALYRESITMYRRLFGEKHNKIADGLNNLANVLQEKGDLAKCREDLSSGARDAA